MEANPSTIYDVLELASAGDPDGVFYFKDDDAIALTFADVREGAERVARQLAAQE